MARGGLAFVAVATTLMGMAFAQAPETAPAAAAEPPAVYAERGPHQVAALSGIWRDTGRNRDVAYFIRHPAQIAAPLPIVIFSHGLGGTERGAVYYSEHLASHGFAVVHVRHPGSDAAIWGGVRPTPGTVDTAALRRVVSDPRVSVDRFRDIPFTVAALRALNGADTPLKGKFDLDRIGMSGHSFGALTTQAAAGMVFPSGASMPAQGIKAFLAMSPSGARDGDDRAAFVRIARPFMFMTGTEDSFGVAGDSPAAVLRSRKRPFDVIVTPPTYFVNLTGGDHFVFSGRQEMGESRPSDARHHAIVRAGALAFFRAYLVDDAAARAWLNDGGYAAFAGADAAIERKPGR